MILSLILSFIGIVAIIFTFIDGFISFNEWQQRIHIGNWKDREIWQKAVEKKAKEWLLHSPTVRISDQNRLLLFDILCGKFRSKTIQSWQDAGLLLGLDDADAKLYIKTHSSLFQSKNYDIALLAYALKKKNALTVNHENEIKKLFVEYSKNKKTIPYRNHIPHIRFVDTIGLVCPFLYICDLKDLASLQIKEYDKALLNGTFPFHAYNLIFDKPLGIPDWGRGLGWYILGLIETINLDNNKTRILQIAKQLYPLLRDDGGLSCMFFNPNERFESSSTTLAGLLFIKAFELSGKNEYLDAAKKIEHSLMRATRRNGAIDYAQGDTKGIGFYSRHFSTMPFAQGMTLYFSKELNKYLI